MHTYLMVALENLMVIRFNCLLTACLVIPIFSAVSVIVFPLKRTAISNLFCSSESSLYVS